MDNIIPIDLSELPEIKNLLEEVDLPISDLDVAPVHFFGIKNGTNIIAVGALEVYGTNAILRSVAVKSTLQNQGLGKEIVSFLETKAKEMGIRQLFLLTTTADAFFKKLNYLPTDREKCPREIRESEEFANLCPSIASCLSKQLSVPNDSSFSD